MFLALTMVAAMAAHPYAHVSSHTTTTTHVESHTVSHVTTEDAVTRPGMSEEESQGKSPSPVYTSIHPRTVAPTEVSCDKVQDPERCPDNMLPEAELHEETDDVHSHPIVWFIATLVVIVISIKIGKA